MIKPSPLLPSPRSADAHGGSLLPCSQNKQIKCVTAYVTHPTLKADFDGFYTVSNKSHERCFFILNLNVSAIRHQFGLFY